MCEHEHHHEEEENENLTNIKEKDTKWKIGKIEAGFEKRWT